MTSKRSPTFRIRTTQLGNCTTVQPLSILLAAHAFQAYHGLLSEARRAFFPSPPRQKDSPAGFACLNDLAPSKTRPALLRRRIYPITLNTGKNSDGGHEIR